MRINWEKLGFRRDRGTLIRAGIFFLASAVAVLFFYFKKEDIKGKDDLTFISGPFAEYSWIEHGGRNGSTLTFKLQNYSNRFQVKADFYSILQKDKFKSISYGDTLSIGIPTISTKSLNRQKELLLVYAIASENSTYLDLNEAVDKHNSPLFLFMAGLFAISGYTLIHFGRRAKVKTPIW